MTAPLVITMGEPAGIGTEIAAKAWLAEKDTLPCFILIDDADRVTARLKDSGIDVPAIPVADLTEGRHMFARGLPVLAVKPTVRGVAPGKPDTANAKAVIGAIDQAIDLVRSGHASGMVTNPINKKVLLDDGFRYPGHTEYLTHRAGDVETAMMLTAPGLRVVPVTVHLPLKDVSAALSADLITSKARVTAQALKQFFGCAIPRLAVLGLNPHAGDGGAIGSEEQDIIAPAVDRLKAHGLTVEGPLPADTVFHDDALGHFDAVICMYHDQALIPLKTLDFWNGVNVTLGLPYIRTSPDHGTAFDLAGTGQANPSSLIAAIRLAGEMADSRRAPS